MCRRARKYLAVVMAAAALLPACCAAQNPYSLTNGQVLGPSQAMLELAPDAGVPRAPRAPGPIYAAPAPDDIRTGNVPQIEAQESLDDAWRIALSIDQRVAAGDFNVSAADHALAAAGAERFPTLNLGANYLALSDQLAIKANVPPLPPTQLPFISRDSLGFNAVISQPIYTFGRISSGIDAAGAEVDANQADAQRTRLDIKMSVAEVYIAVLRAIRVVEVDGSRVASLAAHARDVDNRFRKGVASRNELLAVQVALADAQQQAVQARNALEMLSAAYNRGLRRRLTDPVHLVDVPGDGGPGNVDELTNQACACRPELAELSAQARALRCQADAERAKRAPQISVSGGYLYQQDQYVDPNGVAGVALSAQWNAFDSGRGSEQAAAALVPNAARPCSA